MDGSRVRIPVGLLGLFFFLLDNNVSTTDIDDFSSPEPLEFEILHLPGIDETQSNLFWIFVCVASLIVRVNEFMRPFCP